MKNSLKSILEDEGLNISENPFGTDKGDHKSYIDFFYEYHFAPFRHKNISLLEIGVRHGASLRLWSRYFEDAALLMGIDNGSDLAITHESPFQADWTKGSNIRFTIADAYTQTISNKIDEQFDIMIDDGPHYLWSQIKFIELYSSKLKHGGIIVIEDLLKGYLTCLALLVKTPLKFRACIFDFRWHRPGRDNMIYALKNTGKRRSEVLRRVFLCARCLVMLPREVTHNLLAL
ncbi:class I SAM-dependent methyltransferase [Vulcanococcus sp.]|jgi:SAM-dependent methyltransferase|uniref:class I SAM-dependent methyltransferase n=1 Tax=Vulcanococcus sp. TaxID=2856995 RepID=UPI0037D9AC05